MKDGGADFAGCMPQFFFGLKHDSRKDFASGELTAPALDERDLVAQG